MLKYYICALIKANLIVFLIFTFLYFSGMWEISTEFRPWFWLMINLSCQCTKPSYITAERRNDFWTWIRITEGKKWYHRFINKNVKERLKDIE